MTTYNKMKQIPLTQGQFAIVDDEDFEWLNRHKWYAHWSRTAKSYYAVRSSKRINGKQYNISMAREILGLKHGDKRQADHINHNTLNNRRLNLRIVTHQRNQWNYKSPRGYIWHKTKKMYQTQIQVNGKIIHLGYFQLPEEARKAYLVARKIYHTI